MNHHYVLTWKREGSVHIPSSMTAFLVHLAISQIFLWQVTLNFLLCYWTLHLAEGYVLHTLFIISYLEGCCWLLRQHPNVIPKSLITTYGSWKKQPLSHPSHKSVLPLYHGNKKQENYSESQDLLQLGNSSTIGRVLATCKTLSHQT